MVKYRNFNQRAESCLCFWSLDAADEKVTEQPGDSG
jgi:hypothetical protein